jgi:hypothetical protein
MPSSNRVPDWILERIAHADLSGPERQAAQPRLDADPSAGKRLEELRAADDELRARLPPFARLEERARAARKERGQGRRRWPILLPAIAAVAVAVLILRPQDLSSPPREGAESTRIKGNNRLILHRKTAGGSEPLRDGATARPGEVVQIGYSAATETYGVIISIDGRGAVTLHHPELPNGSTQLEVNGLLPAAYQLDDAPGFERFILVTSRAPVPVDGVLQAARALAANPQRARGDRLQLPEIFTQSSILVSKVHP